MMHLGHYYMHPIVEKLKGGDRRSIGKSDEVVAEVLAEPGLFDIVFANMLSDDPVLCMRCADAVEKITARHPEYLQPYKRALIEQVACSEQQEVRWHVAQMVPRLTLNARERKKVVGILLNYLNDKSSIVRTFSMQALAGLAESDTKYRPQVIQILAEAIQTGTPAMKSRGRKLVKRLKAE